MRDDFDLERQERINNPNSRIALNNIAIDFMLESFKHQYSYDFDWMGVPIIQYPEDIVRLQEIIWKENPDCIIETGVARGGSLIFSASLLSALEQQEIFINKDVNNHLPINRKVFGVDIDIRVHNRERIEMHYLSKYIELIQGSSISTSVLQEVEGLTKKFRKRIVLLDSHHSEKHVLDELRMYSKLVPVNSLIVVYDTVCEFFGISIMPEKGWGIGNNPYTAVVKFLEENKNFILDPKLNSLVGVSTCQFGYLRRVS